MKKLYLLIVCLFLALGLQAQVEKTIENTAGSLKTLLSSTELATITDLTITGTIDARDFKTMRHDMPVLSVVDISETTIIAYTDLFPANTIPARHYETPDSETHTFTDKTTLTSIKLPNTITAIGEDAFLGCINLSSVTFPEGLQSIGRAAFVFCASLTSVELPSSLTTMGWQVFDRCTNLSSVRLPPTLKVIEIATFADCVALKTIDIPSTVTAIDQAAFMGCVNLQSLVLPPSLVTIGDKSFMGCTSLTSLPIPSSVINIEGEAFSGCTSLTEINIPLRVKTIGYQAFYGCTSLTSIHSYTVQPVDLGNDFTKVFGKIDLSKVVLYVPEGSGELYAHAIQWRDFEHITEMPGIKFSTTTVTLKDQETTASIDIDTQLAWEASSDQAWLTVDPLSGTGSQPISFSAQENTSLTTRRATVVFAVSDSIQYEINVVQKGLSITVSLEAPGTFSQQLTTDQLSTLSELIITGPMDARDFKIIRDQMPLLEVLDLRGASISAYFGSEGTFPYMSPWDYPADELPDMALNEAWLAYRKFRLTTLYLPETCTSVGREALSNCIGLKEVIFPPSVVEIKFMAFSGCYGLKSVTMPSVTTIFHRAFEECRALTEIHMPSIITLNKSAFEACYKLSSLSLPATLLTIGEEAFYFCLELSSVEIGSSVTEIGPQAFFECHNLRTVNIPKSVTFIGMYAFYNCMNLQSIYSYHDRPLDLSATKSAGVFAEVDKSNCILYVPYGTKEYYEQAIQWNEFENIVEMGELYLSATELSMEAIPTSRTLKITTGGEWTALCDQEWLSLSPASGDSTQTITFTALENMASAARTATITFSAANGYSQTLTVTQHQRVNSIPVAHAGEDQSVMEEATVTLDGSASTDADNDTLIYMWSAPDEITLSSTNDVQPTFTAPTVDRDTAYTFTLVVNDGKENSVSDKVIITVTNKDIELALSADSIVFESMESTANITITGNAEWTVISDQSWLTVSPVDGTGDRELTFTADANSEVMERIAIVTVSAAGADDQIVVTQKGITTEVAEMAQKRLLVSCYPNPFTREMAIEIANPSLSMVSVEIYSISGQKIKTLSRALKEAKISLTWDGSNEQGQQAPEGMYLLKMNEGTMKVVKR